MDPRLDTGGWLTLTGEPLDSSFPTGTFTRQDALSFSQRDNGKRKGSGNRKNGNKYLGWAFVEAAHFAIRWEPKIRAYHQRKLAKAAHPMVALKAVANKLARACYYVLLRQEPFDVNRAFSG